MRFITEHKGRWGVAPICRELQVAPSSSYAEITRPPSARRRRDEVLEGAIRRVWDEHRRVYGADKVWAQLKREGIPVARCTVERLMRRLGLRGVARGRPSVRTTIGNEASDRPLDLVARQFRAPAPNRPWVADLTYVKTHGGWVYVAFVVDVCSRFVVGWQASRSLRTDLALDALEMARWPRRACGGGGIKPGGSRIVHLLGMLELLVLLLGVVRAGLRSRADLAAENLLLRHQLAVVARPTRKRPRLRGRDKLLWVLARRLCPGWRRHLVLVRPETVVRWHRAAWKLFWRLRSRPRLGRPRLNAEIRALITAMARDNPRWGTERIRGELLKLGIVVSNRSIRRHRGRKPPRPPSQTWRTFLANHRPQIWAADLLTVQTLTFKTLYVLLFITHDRRELVHCNVTAHPTAAWVWRQLIEATPWGRRPRYLIRDRDAVYGRDFVRRAKRLGIEALVTPVRAPRANAIAERLVGILRRECLDHLIVLNEWHPRSVLGEFVAFYNADRPHRSLGLETPQPAARPGVGAIRARPVLGGLHHVYERAA